MSFCYPGRLYGEGDDAGGVGVFMPCRVIPSPSQIYFPKKQAHFSFNLLTILFNFYRQQIDVSPTKFYSHCPIAQSQYPTKLYLRNWIASWELKALTVHCQSRVLHATCQCRCCPNAAKCPWSSTQVCSTRQAWNFELNFIFFLNLKHSNLPRRMRLWLNILDASINRHRNWHVQ